MVLAIQNVLNSELHSRFMWNNCIRGILAFLNYILFKEKIDYQNNIGSLSVSEI